MKSSIKKGILLLALTLACNSYSQTQKEDAVKDNWKEILLSQAWATNHIVGLDPKIVSYTLSSYNPEIPFAGNRTEFSGHNSFNSKYTAWCGNDYFTEVTGNYKFVGTNQINLSVSTVSYSGQWKKPTEIRPTNYLKFSIAKSGNTIVLTQVK